MRKTQLKKKFKEIYTGKERLLAIQLDGFSHAIVYDHGKNSEVKFDRFSHCMPEGGWSSRASQFFKDISNSAYQNNAKEFIFVLPAKR